MLCNGKQKIYITPAHLYKNFWFAPQKNNTFSLVLLVWTGSFGTITTIINSDIYYTCTLWKGGECGLEMADASTDGVTGLDAGDKVSNKSAISDVRLDLEIAFPNCDSIK